MPAKYAIRGGRVVALPGTPAVADCRDCGACCRHMGTPPGYAAMYADLGRGRVGPAEWVRGTPDHRRWLKMPTAVRATLDAYYAALRRGEVADRTREYVDRDEHLALARSGRTDEAVARLSAAGDPATAVPCLWYDPDAKTCRHHGWRPDVCREFPVGGRECVATRKAWSIPLPTVPA